jgi:hypothetical protein
MRDGSTPGGAKPPGVFFSASRRPLGARRTLANIRAMRISAQLAMWMCAAFGLVCLGFAVNGFTGLAGAADPAEAELIAGYAWFWTFLASIALVFGVLSWLIRDGKLGRVE